MRVLIVAGGGGHFAAAFSVIEKLPKDADFLVVGRKYAFEADKTLSFEYITSKKLGINFKPLATGRIQRKISFEAMRSFIKIPFGFFQAVKIISSFKPDVVLSFGGYVAYPICAAGYFRGIPIVVHEQTLGAGITSKETSRFASKILISWEQSARFFSKEKTVLTGNPIRSKQIKKGKWQTANSHLPVVFVTGGSAGAHDLNLLIEGCLNDLLQNYNVIHQTGDARKYKDFERLSELKKNLKDDLRDRYKILKFADPDEILNYLNYADLVVSRSGINIVSEILSLGKTSLFIPLPYGQKNEQLTNAEFVQKTGIAEVIEQKDITPLKLFKKIKQMLKSLNVYQESAEKAKALVSKDAADKIIDIIYAEKRS